MTTKMTSKPVKLESPERIVTLANMPIAVQMKASYPHVQILLPVPGIEGAVGYTSIEAYTHKLTEVQKATLKLATAKAKQGDALTESYSGSGEKYIPLVIENVGGVLSFTLDGITILTARVEAGIGPLVPVKDQPSAGGWTADPDGEDEDEDEDGDDD